MSNSVEDSCPKHITAEFDHLGKTGDAVSYDEDTRVLTFNVDCEFICSLREQEKANVLLAVAAAHMAHEASETMAEFTWMYRQIMEQMVPPTQEAAR